MTIYWVVQSGEENQVIENLLSKYDSLSDHITVVKKNPDVYPTFAEQYTDDTVHNNSLVVECGERSRFIGYNDIFMQGPDIYSFPWLYCYGNQCHDLGLSVFHRTVRPFHRHQPFKECNP